MSPSSLEEPSLFEEPAPFEEPGVSELVLLEMVMLGVGTGEGLGATVALGLGVTVEFGAPDAITSLPCGTLSLASANESARTMRHTNGTKASFPFILFW